MIRAYLSESSINKKNVTAYFFVSRASKEKWGTLGRGEPAAQALSDEYPKKMVLFSFKVFRGRKCYLFYQLIVVSISEILEDFDKNEWNI